MTLDEIKRKIRTLKGLELKIRFGKDSLDSEPPAVLVWHGFFGKGAKYTLHRLTAMSGDDYRSVLDEFFFNVYEQFYKENGITEAILHDPAKLSQLGLPRDADMAAIKSRFHTLAKAYHPDYGGDSEKFIALMKIYKELVDN